MSAAAVGLALVELVKFAAAAGDDIGRVVDAFRVARPDLCGSGDPCAPPERDDAAIDGDVDKLIDAGEL